MFFTGWEEDPTEDVLELLACYYGMMRCVDDGLGQLLDTLSRLELDKVCETKRDLCCFLIFSR